MGIIRRPSEPASSISTTIANDLSSLAKEPPPKLYVSKDAKWVSSGCPTLNLALSGNVRNGYVVGRTVNCVADYSTGKTLLASELVNQCYHIEHLKNKKKVKVVYCDPERKFPTELARQGGFPVDWVHWEYPKTIEDYYELIRKETRTDQGKWDILLIVKDSLDAMLDKRSQKHSAKKGVGAQDYKVGVAAIMSQLFKELQGDIADSNCINWVISQLRAKVNAGLWESPYTKAGGNALNFYSTHIMWLWQKGEIKHENGFVQGVKTEAALEKNHAYLENRRARFNIVYGYGIDHIGSTVEFATEHNIIPVAGSWYTWGNFKVQGSEKLVPLFENNPIEYERLLEAVQHKWNELEEEARIVRKPRWT